MALTKADVCIDAPLEDGDAVAAADVVGNLGGEALVVHQQEVQLPYVADQELLQTIGEKVASLEKRVMG